MKGLRIVLWVCAVGFLLSLVFLFIPWRFMASWMNRFGIDVVASAPIKAYMVRAVLAGSGMVGIFFAILAKDPLRYGPMLPLAGWGLIFVGLICLVAGIRYQLPPVLFCVDVVFSIVAGALILIFRSRAIEE